MKNLILFTFLSLTLITSCNDPDKPPVVEEDNGIFILNEGNITWSNASLSIYNPDSGSVQNNIFQIVNGSPLGDVAQSMIIYNNNAFIAMNNSNKIYIMDVQDYTFQGKITELTSPRHMHVVNESKAYVTDLYADIITIFNPTTFVKTGSIDIGHSTEKIIALDGYIYVTSWSYDSLLFKIDPQTDEVYDSVQVGFQPNSIIVDANKKLWILCDGGYQGIPQGHKHAVLQRVNPLSMEIELELTFPELNDNPIQLTASDSKQELFYLNGGIYKFAISDENLPETAFIPKESKNFYSLGIDPETGEIYVGDAASYVQPGLAYRFDKFGNQLDSFYVGINPGYFCFQ